MSSEETWRPFPIPEYQELYFVSDFGRVKSADRKCWNGKIWFLRPSRVLNIFVGTSGYNYITASKDKRDKNFLIHRLVLLAFLGADPIRTFGNHKNGRKTDNRLENLEWTTCQENNRHAWDSGLCEANRETAMRAGYPVEALFQDGHIEGPFDNIYRACAHFGLPKKNAHPAGFTPSRWYKPLIIRRTKV